VSGTISGEKWGKRFLTPFSSPSVDQRALGAKGSMVVVGPALVDHRSPILANIPPVAAE
jgi:hypothetical protein